MKEPIGGATPLVPTEALVPALEQLLSRYRGGSCRVTALNRVASAYRSTFALEELNVQLEGGAELDLIFKDLSPRSLASGSRPAKPSFLYDPEREITVYKWLSSDYWQDTAIFYGAVVDEPGGRYWLFLEKIAGDELYTCGEFEIWKDVARWLAHFHRRSTTGALDVGMRARLICYDGDYYRRWMKRAVTFVSGKPERTAGDHRRIHWLAERHAVFMSQLEALPATLIHGEFYASNVIVRRLAAGTWVCPIDWETAAIGPGMVDLAALIAGAWSEPEKVALANAYWAELDAGGGGDGLSLATTLDLCRLHIAVQWLGWSADWTPPLAHEQDWLTEAVSVAERIRP